MLQRLCVARVCGFKKEIFSTIINEDNYDDILMMMIAGVGLIVVLSVIIICSMKWVRKSGNFEVSHTYLCYFKGIASPD